MAMTPGASKVPLPKNMQQGDRSNNTPAVRITPIYPFELHHVKGLFLERRYQQCIQQCQSALALLNAESNTVEGLFLNFYAAMSHDCQAQLMHDSSSAKLATIASAEALYVEALRYLEILQRSMANNDALRMQAGHSGYPQTPLSFELAPQHTGSAAVPRSDYDRSPELFTFLPTSASHTTQSPRNLELSSDIENLSSHGNFREIQQPSEFPDLESHNSFEETQTPTRAFARDPRARRSLLAPTTQSSRTLTSDRIQRSEASVNLLATFSHGIPDRTRSASFSTSDSASMSELSQEFLDSPVRQAEHDDQHGMPILAYDQSRAASPLPSQGGSIPTNFTCSESWNPESNTTPLTTHFSGLFVQLNTHLTLLRTLQSQTLAAQAERQQRKSQRAREPAFFSSPLPKPRDEGGEANKAEKQIPQGRSYWSLSSPDTKQAAKAKRVEEGRARVWQRPRFDAAKYERLAEVALQELEA
ncbi:hypothetical protein H2203_004446 [Taxawa tesnikishii (nom. ined.)]|nr:hypothetical protein H2203_004446 [Dothideales sp. JES 119]